MPRDRFERFAGPGTVHMEHRVLYLAMVRSDASWVMGLVVAWTELDSCLVPVVLAAGGSAQLLTDFGTVVRTFTGPDPQLVAEAAGIWSDDMVMAMREMKESTS